MQQNMQMRVPMEARPRVMTHLIEIQIQDNTVEGVCEKLSSGVYIRYNSYQINTTVLTVPFPHLFAK